MEEIILEYQIRDNCIRIVKEHYINNKHKKNIRYIFQFKNSNNSDSTSPKTNKAVILNYKYAVVQKTFMYKSLSPALKHFNKAVAALNNGTNIK